ncbi:MAG: Flp pilus assembly protein CpaB [Alphaproteobacteria bacterium]
MSPRKVILLLVALLLAGGVIMMARQALAPQEDVETAAAAVPAGPEVLVAAHDLPAGTLLKDDDMKWQVWPSDPKDTMIVKSKADKLDYIGALSRGSLRAGEAIIANRIFKTHEQGFLSAALAPGMRAISVKITPVSGIAGLVFPGDHVDVLVARNIPIPGQNGQSQDRRVSETVVTNARVLALDQKTDEKVTDPKVADVATIEVSPKDAEKISLISDWGGNLSLVLRSLNDDHTVASEPAGQGSNDGVSVSSRKSSYTWDSDVSGVIPRPDIGLSAPHKVQIIRGKDTTEVNFEQ